MLASLLDGMNEGAPGSAGATSATGGSSNSNAGEVKNLCPPRWALWKCAGAMSACC